MARAVAEEAMTDDPCSVQSLLALRRSLVLEQSHASDPMEHAVLQFTIDEIDREVAARTKKARA